MATGIAPDGRVDLTLFSIEALQGCCERCGHADLPLTDVRCTSEVSGEVWHNVYCATCMVKCVGRGYLTRNERAYGAGSTVERILPVIAEPIGSWQPPDRIATRRVARACRATR